MNDSVIQAEGLTKRYGELTAVDRVSLAVAPVSGIHVFGGMRAAGLNVPYLALGVAVFLGMFRAARRRGLLINVGE